MKKRLYVFAALLAAGSLTACAPKADGGGQPAIETGIEAGIETETAQTAGEPETQGSGAAQEEAGGKEEEASRPEGQEGQEENGLEGQDGLEGILTSQDEKLNEIYEAVREAYGEDYIPSMEIDGEMLENIYGISGSWYEACIAEGPMMSAHVETFMGFKAVPGHEGDIAAALYDYRDKQLESGVQYPMNLPKLEASQVCEEDGYVFFVMLGSPDMEAEEQGEEAALKSAQEKNQAGVDVIESFFE